MLVESSVIIVEQPDYKDFCKKQTNNNKKRPVFYFEVKIKNKNQQTNKQTKKNTKDGRTAAVSFDMYRSFFRHAI